MGVWIATRADRYGDQLAGWYRTEALLDAAVAANSELVKVDTAILEADFPADSEANADYYLYDADADDPPARKVVRKGHPPVYTPRALAALTLLRGIAAFSEFVDTHADGVPADAVALVHRFLRQKRRTCRMAYQNNVEIGGSVVTLTDVQFVAWATFCRFGPLDTSAVTALGQYNPEGLFDIFERAEDPTVIDPTGPITWVGLDTASWGTDAQGNANAVPNRLNVAEIAPVLGTAPSQYENVDDDSWLRSS